MQSRIIGKTYALEDLFQIRVLENLEYLRKLSLGVDIEDVIKYEYFNAVINDSQNALAVERDFVDNFFNEKFTLDYNKFCDRAKSIYETNVFNRFDGYVKGDIHKERVKEVAIPPVFRYFDLLTRMHEFSHYLNYKRCPKLYFDYLKTEVHSIFLEHLFHDYCIKKEYIMNEENVTWYFHLDAIIRFLRVTDYDFETVIKDHKIETSYDEFLLNILYYYGYVYSNKLFEFYLDNEKKFLKRYMGIYHGSSLDELCDYYGISFDKDDTIEPTLQRIKIVKEGPHVK